MSAVRARFVQVAILVVVVAGLQLAYVGELLNRNFLPAAPLEIVERLGELLTMSTTWDDLSRTLLRIGVSFLIAVMVGLLVGFSFWRMPRFATAFEPVVSGLYTVPWLALYPVLLVILGIGEWPIYVTGAILAFVPIALNVHNGLAAVRPVHLKVARTFRCSRRQVITKVLIPDAMPHIAAGAKLGLLYAYLGALATEFLQSPNGLGYQIHSTYVNFQDVDLNAYVTLVVVFTMVSFILLDHVERRVGRRFR